MDKRATPRIEVNTVATAQLLGDSPDANGQINPAMIVDVSERGIRLRSPVRMKPGQAVKVEIADVMFLCEV